MINKTMIKICGVTDLETAQYLIDNHIEFIGFIFYPLSVRYRNAEYIKSILNKIKRSAIRTVGVFVNEDIQKIINIATFLNLDYIQLHGLEGIDYLQMLKDFRIIKSFRIGPHFNEKLLQQYNKPNVEYFLFDTYSKTKFGGTGKSFDWETAPFIKKYRNIIISGGLNEKNIVKAVNFFRPAIVDLNSGVKSKPGIKSHEKIEHILSLLKR